MQKQIKEQYHNYINQGIPEVNARIRIQKNKTMGIFINDLALELFNKKITTKGGMKKCALYCILNNMNINEIPLCSVCNSKPVTFRGHPKSEFIKTCKNRICVNTYSKLPDKFTDKEIAVYFQILKNKLNNNTDIEQFSQSLTRDQITLLNGSTKYLNLISGKVSSKFRLYCIANKIYSEQDIPKCSCGKPRCKSQQWLGFGLSCGNPYCYQKLSKVNHKRQETATNNHGSLKEAYDNTETMMEKYGVSNASQSEEIINQKEQNNIKKYGARYSWMTEEGKEHQKQGVFEKYGVFNISQLDWVKAKKEESAWEKYGVRNVAQLPEVRESILKSSGKIYTLSNGQEVCLDSIREKIAAEYLLSLGHIIKPQPLPKSMKPEKCFWWNDTENISHVWFPDFKIIHDDIFVEVKSYNWLGFEDQLLWDELSGCKKTHLILVDPGQEKIYHLLRDNKNPGCWFDLVGNINANRKNFKVKQQS